MKKNVGSTDRAIRFVLGIAIIIAGVYFSSWWGVMGAVIMLPTLLGSDPIYNMLGVDTNRNSS